MKKVMHAENPRVWFDDKKAASAKPRRGLLFHLFPLGLFFAVGTACAAPDFTINGNQLTAVNPNGSISITVPGHVTSIAENAFAGCGYVTSLTIPDSVTHLAESALYGCDGLRSLTLPYVPVSDSYGGSSIKLCGLERLFSRIASSRERTITPVGSVEFRIDPQGYSYYFQHMVTNWYTRYYQLGGIPSSLTSVTVTCAIYEKAFNKSVIGNGLSVTIGGEVAYIGNYAFQDCNSLTNVTIVNGVKNINVGAFEGCSGLTSVRIPNSVTNIGASAFSGCRGLTNATISSGVAHIGDSAFKDCSGLESVTIPNSVTNIGEYAFSGCNSLTNATISGGVKNIGRYAFNGCSGLKSVTIPNSVTDIGNSAFNGCSGLVSVTIPSSVTDIRDSAFYGCNGLKEVHITDLSKWVCISFGSSSANPLYYADNFYLNGSLITDLVIPDGVTGINGYTFYNCSCLTSVRIPDSVMNIGSDAFRGCTNVTNLVVSFVPPGIDAARLTSITIPYGVTRIRDSAFNGCNGLSVVTIPNSVTDIGNSAFSGCSGLTSVRIPNSVTKIGDAAFSDCSGLTNATLSSGVAHIGNSAFKGCYRLASVTVPNSVTNIGEYAFSGCSSLTSATISEGVKNIGRYAFNGCNELKEVHISDLSKWFRISFGSSDANPLYYARNLYLNGSLITDLMIPDGVTGVNGYAFCNCSCLTSVTIPEGVVSIGLSAFEYCDGLKFLTIPDSVTYIAYSAFNGCNRLESLSVGASLTSSDIKSHFGSKTALGNVTIPQSVCLDNVASVFYCSNHSITNVVVAEGVTRIANQAFTGLDGLKSVWFPESLLRMGDEVFSDCSALREVRFDGDAPDVGADIYVGTSRSLMTYVWEGTRGWAGGISTELPSEWNGRALEGVSKVALSSISISGSERVESGGSATYSCTATMDGGATKKVVPEWSIASGAEYASISSLGVLTAAATDVARTVVVLATYTEGGAIRTASKTVTVAAREIVIPDPEPEPEPEPGAIRFGPGYGSRFSISANEEAHVVGVYGLTWKDFPARAYDGYHVFADSRIVDREKNSGANAIDHDWCETYAKLVMCVWSGWSKYLGFTDEDALSDYLLDQDERDVLGYAAARASSSWKDMGKHLGTVNTDATFPQALAAAFEGADRLMAAMVCIDNYVWYGTRANWGHFVTCCGFSIDTGKPLSDPTCLKGLFIIDSDNDRENGGGGASAPDTISYCPVSWDAAKGRYEISNIFGTTGYFDTHELCTTLSVENPVEAQWSVDILPGPENAQPVWTIDQTGILTGVVLNGCTDIVIPDGVAGIGAGAFQGCSGLKSVTIPYGVTSIGASAFSGCSGLTKVVFEGDAPAVPESAFAGAGNGCAAYVKQGSAGWNTAIPGSWKGLAIRYLESGDLKFDLYRCDNHDGAAPVKASPQLGYGSTTWSGAGVPWRAGHTFAGWWTQPDGGVMVYGTDGSCLDGKGQPHCARYWSADKRYSYPGDLVVYAHWTAKSYDLYRCQNYDGAAAAKASPQLTYGSGTWWNIGVPWRAGYTFEGWWTLPNGGVMVYGRDGSCLDGKGQPHCATYWTADKKYIYGGDLAVYAHWTAKSYNLYRCDNHDGAAPVKASPQLGYGSTTWSGAGVPWRAGHTFNGWWTQPDGGVMVYGADGSCLDGSGKPYSATYWSADKRYSYPGDLVVYAHWTAKSYDLYRCQNYDGAAPAKASPQLTCGSGTWWNIGVPWRAGYTFEGWWTLPNGGVMVYGRDGSCLDGNGQPHCATYWTADKKYIYGGDLAVYARWTANSYDLYRCQNYGGADPAKASPQLTCGSTTWSNASVPWRAGYTFEGWWTQPSGGVMVYGADGSCLDGSGQPHCATYWTTDKRYVYGGNLVVYARWTAKQYSLTRDPNGGKYNGNTAATTSANALTYDAGAYWDISAPTRDGYTFKGWFTGTSGGVMVYDEAGKRVTGDYWNEDRHYIYGGDLAVYARWTANSYDLYRCQNYDGADPVKASPQLTYGSTTWSSAGVPWRAGHTFDGWWTKPDGGEMVYGRDGSCLDGNGQPYNARYWTANNRYANAGDLVVYAHWTANSYDLYRCQNYDGAAPVKASPQLKYGSTSWWSVGVPWRAGYTFEGWWTQPNGGEMVYGRDGSCLNGNGRPHNATYWTADKRYVYGGNLVVYAHWTANSYDLYRCQNYDGAAPVKASPLLTYGSTTWSTIGTPWRTGYTFEGWWTQPDGGVMVYGRDGSCLDGSGRPHNATYWTADKRYAYGGNLVVYAHWTATGTKYSLTRDPNGGTYQGKSVAVTVANALTYGSAAYWDIGVPVRPDQTFLGWYTTPTGGTMVYDANGKCIAGDYWDSEKHYRYAGNLTVYAHWQVPDPIAVALDNTSLTFTTGGSSSWYAQSDYTYDGVDAVRSGALSDSQSCWLQTTVTGPGTISFRWYASCEGYGVYTNWDYLAVLIDGVEKARICGTDNSWEYKSYSVPSGSHVIRWMYRKDVSYYDGLDAGFVDQVVWTPVSKSAQVAINATDGKWRIGNAELPEWAIGTFDGAVLDAEASGPAGLVTLCVAADGSLSGKMLEGGRTWTLSAPALEDAGGACRAAVTGTSGDLSFTGEVTISLDETSPCLRGVASCKATSASPAWTAWQNIWKTEPCKAVAEQFAEAPDLVTPDGVSMRFSSTGAVAAKCGGRSCSATLIPAADGTFTCFLYFPPKGEAASYVAEIKLMWDGSAFSMTE